MSDEDNTAPAPEYFIPSEIVSKWEALSPAAPVAVTLTKDDLEYLFAGLRGAIIAQNRLATAMDALIAQDLAAHKSLAAEARVMQMDSFNATNIFITRVMAKAAPDFGGADE